MSATLAISITLPDQRRHAQGATEWPPSPLRLFQALFIASCHGGHPDSDAMPALLWLESQPAPDILAPARHLGQPVRLAVPNNDLDSVASAWARGREPQKQPNELKSMKPVRPAHLLGGDVVRYLYPLDGDPAGHAETIARAARCLTHLGWGVDMVAGHGEIIAAPDADRLRQSPAAELWQLGPGRGAALRVPAAGTCQALRDRYAAFLGRLSDDGFSPVPALTAFATAAYRRSTDVAVPSWAAFEIWKPLDQLAALTAGQSRFRPFDAPRQTVVVAAMARHAAAEAARLAGRPEQWVRSFVLGHAPDGGPAAGDGADHRLAFLPLPSVTPLKVESIRRLLITAPPGEAAAWLRQALSGRQLVPEDDPRPAATLSVMSDNDANLSRHYTGEAQVWSTVTPVILPGRYTRGPSRALKLFRETFRQAGWPAALVDAAELEWRDAGFRPGVDLARRHAVPAQLSHLPRYHVRVRWPHAVPGPLAAGAGRYRGLGLFAAETPAG